MTFCETVGLGKAQVFIFTCAKAAGWSTIDTMWNGGTGVPPLAQDQVKTVPIQSQFCLPICLPVPPLKKVIDKIHGLLVSTKANIHNSHECSLNYKKLTPLQNPTCMCNSIVLDAGLAISSCLRTFQIGNHWDQIYNICGQDAWFFL